MTSQVEMQCDKHSDTSLHRPMRASTNKFTGKEDGSYYCPNIDSRDEAGNVRFCAFTIAPSYQPSPTQRFANSNLVPEESGDVEFIN